MGHTSKNLRAPKKGGDEYANAYLTLNTCPSTPKLRYRQDKHASAKQLLRATLLLLLPYKEPCCCWPPRVCCHTLTTDWLPCELDRGHAPGVWCGSLTWICLGVCLWKLKCWLSSNNIALQKTLLWSFSDFGHSQPRVFAFGLKFCAECHKVSFCHWMWESWEYGGTNTVPAA